MKYDFTKKLSEDYLEQRKINAQQENLRDSLIISKPYVSIFPDILPTTHDFHLMIFIELLSGLEGNESNPKNYIENFKRHK